MDCSFCNVSEDLPFTCSYCELIFCSSHRLPEKHQCTVNYKEINKDTYFSGLGGGLYTKLEVI